MPGRKCAVRGCPNTVSYNSKSGVCLDCATFVKSKLGLPQPLAAQIIEFYTDRNQYIREFPGDMPPHLSQPAEPGAHKTPEESSDPNTNLPPRNLPFSPDDGEVQTTTMPTGEYITFAMKHNPDGRELKALVDRPLSEDEILDLAQVDRDKWYVHDIIVNAWGNVEWPGFQTKAYLKRRAPEPLIDGIKGLLDELRAHSFIIPEPKPAKASSRKEKVMIEVSIMDHHFGSLVWGAECGADYDSHIARRLYAKAIEQALDYTAMFSVAGFYFPIGNDLFHVNGFVSETKNGTPQEVDSRFPKVWRITQASLIEGIGLAARRAPVTGAWVPGNHCHGPSFFLCNVLEAAFSATPHVTIDLGASPRKYMHFGACLVGFTHGNEEEHRALPTIMAVEVADLWAKSKHREWHLGHEHKRRARTTTPVNSLDGVTVRVIPSLCPPNSWAHGKGYVGSPRAAEAYIWGETSGYIGHFSLNVEE